LRPRRAAVVPNLEPFPLTALTAPARAKAVSDGCMATPGTWPVQRSQRQQHGQPGRRTTWWRPGQPVP